MTSAAYHAHPALALAAEVTLPVLGVCAVVTPAIRQHAGRLKNPGPFWICAAISIALVYIVRHFCHPAGHWIGKGMNYSTHTAIAVAFGVMISLCRPVLLPAVTVVVAAYLWAITCLGYHTAGDAISTMAIMLPASLLCHLPWLLAKKR